jgi:hypothetical protein
MSLTPNATPYVVTIEQVGANVVVTGSGEFDLTGLTAEGSGPPDFPAAINPNDSFTAQGTLVYLGTAAELVEYIGPITASVSNNIGSGGNRFADDASGPLVALRTAGIDPYTSQLVAPALFLPDGSPGGISYLPNNLVLLSSSTDIFYNTTIAGLGITPGTYTWTWGSGADQSFTIQIPTATHWTNTQGGNWSIAANWNPQVPTANLVADVDAAGTYSVAITKNAIAYGLSLSDAQATVTDSGGALTLAGSGGAANPNGALYIDAGTFVLNGGGLKAGTISIDSGGAFLISKGGYTGSNALSETIIDNGSLIVKTTATITGNISGTGSIVMPNKGVLEFGSLVSDNAAQPFAGTIVGLTSKNSIDLAALTYVAGKTTASYLGGVLTVTNGSQDVFLHLSGNFTNATWVVSKGATGGTIVADPPAPSPTTSPPGLDHAVALFTQSAAGFSDQSQQGVLNTNPLSQIVTNQEQFLANPHHG